MRAKFIILIAIFAALVFRAVADGESKLSSETLRRSFSEVRGLLDTQAALKSVGHEKVIRSEFGTPTHRGVELKSDDFNMTVDSVTGRILSIETISVTKEQDSPGMNEKQAQDTARSLVQHLGVKIDSRMVLIHIGFDVSTGRWRVAWQRRVDGYPFPEETVFVSFNDRNRRLTSFRDRTTNRRCATKPVIDEKRAMASAEVRIMDLLPELFGAHYEIANITQGSLQVVYPNGRYAPQDDSERKGTSETWPQPRLVYTFVLSFKYTGAATLRKSTPPIAVWVDALTGDIVGGL